MEGRGHALQPTVEGDPGPVLHVRGGREDEEAAQVHEERLGQAQAGEQRRSSLRLQLGRWCEMAGELHQPQPQQGNGDGVGGCCAEGEDPVGLQEPHGNAVESNQCCKQDQQKMTGATQQLANLGFR